MKLGHWKSIRIVQKYTESVDFKDSQRHYKATMEELTDAINGLQKSGMVPRPRFELGTRGFSVHQEQLIIEILILFATLGQVAEQLKQTLISNGHRQEQVVELMQHLTKGDKHTPYED